MTAFDTHCSSLTRAVLPGHSAEILIKRDDLIHPIVSGNKWRKLKYLIAEATERGCNQLVTFGGAYSNHMVATACAGAVMGIRTACFIRADEAIHNHYLAAARLYGMQLIPVSREDYRQKEQLFDAHFGQQPAAMFIAEGGASAAAARGVAEIITELASAPDWIVHASATATTALGLAQGIAARGLKTRVLSVAVLRNGDEQREKAREAGLDHIIHVNDEHTLGGYAKTSPELMAFIREFIATTGIMIDPVYTGKALFALQQICPEGDILFLHTGGTLGIFSDAYLKQLT